MIIRKDIHGLYIRGRHYSKALGMTDEPSYRPGYFPGDSHAMDTTDAGLQEGDKPKTSHMAGSPFVRIKMSDGRKVYWGCYGRAEGDFAETKNTT